MDEERKKLANIIEKLAKYLESIESYGTGEQNISVTIALLCVPIFKTYEKEDALYIIEKAIRVGHEQYLIADQEGVFDMPYQEFE